MGMKVEFTFSNELKLVYQLNDSLTTNRWMFIIKQMNPLMLVRNDKNHIHGFADNIKINQYIDELNVLLTGFKIEPVDLTGNDWNQELNRVHVNFPVQLYKGGEPYKWHSCNLLIHWLEYELANKLDNKQEYLINLDFNHSDGYRLTTPIFENEFNNFTPILEFGNLHLHYVYIGRHFLEMFNAKDIVCPPNQFKPQHHFNATCGLVFSESPPTDLISQMRNYYDSRGGKQFFNWDFDDMKLAKGFFKIGQLDNISEYMTYDSREQLRTLLKEVTIQSWKII